MPVTIHSTLHEQAMQMAINTAHRADDAATAEGQHALGQVASAWASIARELRLGRMKSRTYQDVEVQKAKPVVNDATAPTTASAFGGTSNYEPPHYNS